MAIVYKYFPKNRWKYIWRVWVNNMKNMKSEGIASGYSVLLGGIGFFKLCKQLTHTPVSLNVQNYFTQRFGSTQPIFKKLRKRFSNKK
jgi:hypothetical protein